MLTIKKIFQMGAATAILSCATLSALEPLSDLSLSLGWRRDDFKTKAVRKENEEDVGQRNLKISNVDVWQAGIQLIAGMPSCLFDCDESCLWLQQLYIRGYAYRGWTNDGSYQNSITYREESPNHIHAQTHKGRTVDANIGLGYLYSICDSWGLGAVGGWSYDQLRISTTKASNNSSDFNAGDGMTFTSTWQGPWIGIDSVYYLCAWNLTLNASYEYHWSEWTGSNHLRSSVFPSCTLFSDHRRSDNAHGNVVFIDGRWTWCECWDLALGFKYQEWRARGGSLKPNEGTFEEIGCDEYERNKSRDTRWQSFGVNFDIGYRF